MAGGAASTIGCHLISCGRLISCLLPAGAGVNRELVMGNIYHELDTVILSLAPFLLHFVLFIIKPSSQLGA